MSATARLVEIKRMAVHDGPGIRTTLFLKGCPLACRWCHNPETISPLPEIGFLKEKCTGCGHCVEGCPAGAHSLRGVMHAFDRTLCTGCGTCVEACLAGALELYGRTITVGEAVAAVIEDKTFYDESGGGCTVSGGEPLLQADFCAVLFERLHADRIHCAIDTSGAVPWERVARVLPFTDIFLYDLKHIDDAKHREGTGVSNRGILENLRRLSARGIPIEIRIPLIPGFNDASAYLQATAEFLRGLRNIVAVRLLPYHDLARSKYEAVGRADTMPSVSVPDAAGINGAAAVLRQFGLNSVVVP